MAAQPYYPTEVDLDNFLSAAGLTLSAALKRRFSTVVGAARRQYEKDIGRVLLAGSVDTTRYYDPPANADSLLFLHQNGSRGDLAALTSVVYQASGGTAQTLVLTTASVSGDYLPEPANALAEGRPYTAIRFTRGRWHAPQSLGLRRALAITGRWGFAATIPEDAWEAILSAAAMQLYGVTLYGNFSGLIRWEEAGVSEEYDIALLKNLSEGWQSTYRAGVAAYRKAIL